MTAPPSGIWQMLQVQVEADLRMELWDETNRHADPNPVAIAGNLRIWNVELERTQKRILEARQRQPRRAHTFFIISCTAAQPVENTSSLESRAASTQDERYRFLPSGRRTARNLIMSNPPLS